MRYLIGGQHHPISINLKTCVSKHKCYTAYKNLITIFICCFPKHYGEIHRTVVENSLYLEKPDWNFTTYLLQKTWNVVQSRMKNQEADEDDLKAGIHGRP